MDDVLHLGKVQPPRCHVGGHQHSCVAGGEPGDTSDSQAYSTMQHVLCVCVCVGGGGGGGGIYIGTVLGSILFVCVCVGWGGGGGVNVPIYIGMVFDSILASAAFTHCVE